jgi:hypothetical protein
MGLLCRPTPVVSVSGSLEKSKRRRHLATSDLRRRKKRRGSKPAWGKNIRHPNGASAEPMAGKVPGPPAVLSLSVWRCVIAIVRLATAAASSPSQNDRRGHHSVHEDHISKHSTERATAASRLGSKQENSISQRKPAKRAAQHCRRTLEHPRHSIEAPRAASRTYTVSKVSLNRHTAAVI